MNNSNCEVDFLCNMSKRQQFCLNDPVWAMIVSTSSIVNTWLACSSGNSCV